MKIASEIAEEMVGAADSAIWWASAKEQRIAAVESIIAAKLKPVRENLRSLEYLVIADDIALSYLRPALAMLSDEK